MTTSIFDYVIVGAGTAGLVLAHRLSENTELTIAIIEAGENADTDPRVTTPGFWPSIVDSELDWGYKGVPQVSLNGRRIGQTQGKLLGGSSSINVQAVIPFSKLDIDTWEALGNSGWNWASLSPYLSEAFTVTLPDKQTIEHLGVGWAKTLAQTYHGPVQASFADVKENPTGRLWVETFERLGFPLTSSPFKGKSTGPYNALSTINATSKTRSSSSRGYYSDLVKRNNVKMFLDTKATKVQFDNTSSQLRAEGVTIVHNGMMSTIYARREVILSAGVFNTPKLLELSGIGDPKVLTPLGIDVNVLNPNVGRNLQDHIVSSISYEAQDGVLTGDDLARQDPTALQVAMDMYQKHQIGPFATPGITSFGYLPIFKFQQEADALTTTLQYLEDTAAGESSLDAARRDHLKTVLQNGDEGTGQYMLFKTQGSAAGKDTIGKFGSDPQPGNYISIACALSHPLSTGTSHIASADVNQPPLIDHQYLSHDLDHEIFARHIRSLEAIALIEPLASLLKPNGRRNDPKAFVGSDLEKAKDYVQNVSTTNWHSCGTCAMAPREKGGVVDENLRVYGVSGLRIVDASVFPIIPQSNLQALVYAVAGRASDLIKS